MVRPLSTKVAALAALGVLVLSCASAPFPRETRANNARTDDPWLEGETCSGAPRDYAGMRVEDVEAGSGAPVGQGETVRVHYLVSSATGPTIHNTRDGGPPIEIVIGSTKTICGFEKAIVGMRPGGQRRVLVPWTLAFGEAGKPPDVQPKTDLLFVIDLFLPADPTLQNGSGPPRPAMPGRRR